MATEIPKGRWSVPREWSGERCFIIAGGSSVRRQVDLIRRLRGRIIAIKQAVELRPDADVMFVAGRDDPKVCKPYYPKYRGPRIICRAHHPGFPKRTLFLQRTENGAYSRTSTHVGGLDAGASAINLAALFGAKEIILIGMDMTGGRWVARHHLPVIPQRHFDMHLENIATLAPELERDGIRVVNCSPISVIPWFVKLPLKRFV